jgi:glucokinase
VTPLYASSGIDGITAKSIAQAAIAGDETAIKVYNTSGRYLGRGLSILIDILNPERIIIGGVFMRSHKLLWESAEEELKKETLSCSLDVCKVVPSELGENIGDYAALATALL